jgi:acetyl esterase/lipase
MPSYRLKRFPIFRFLFSLAIALTLEACAPVHILNALVPEQGMKETRSIRFGPGDRGKLDVYAPAQPCAGSLPVIVFFYGGGWDSGRREDYLFVAEAFSSRGFITVIPDYRIYPQGLFPDFIEDGALALRWTFENIGKYGGDPQNIFIAGHSAGAQIATMLAFDKSWLARLNVDAGRLRGVIGLAGPYDFLPLETARLNAIFPSEAARAQSQPIRFARRDAPPVLLISGEPDEVVGPGNSRRLAQRIRALGGSVDEKYYPGLGHAKLVAVLAAPLRSNYRVLDDIDEFVESSRIPMRTDGPSAINAPSGRQ